MIFSVTPGHLKGDGDAEEDQPKQKGSATFPSFQILIALDLACSRASLEVGAF